MPRPENTVNWKKYHGIFSTAFLHDALGAAAELEIADRVNDQPMQVSDIARSAELDEGATYRLLRTLAAYGIFVETEGQTFQHNSFSRQLRRDHPYSMHHMIRLWTCEPFRKAWGHFSEAIKDGKSSFLHANGQSVYEYAEANPQLARLFHAGMENNSAIVADAIARSFPFGDFDSVVDLGGGAGTQLVAILRRHQVHGAVFDVPVAADDFKRQIEKRAFTHRAQFLAGNWFESVPDDFDVYLVKNSLWNWADEQCNTILKNISSAMRSHSRLLIIEYLVDTESRPWSTTFDLQQLNVTGGRGRTESEYEAMAHHAGLEVSASFQVENENILVCKRTKE